MKDSKSRLFDKKKINLLIAGILSILILNPSNVNAKLVAYSIGTKYNDGINTIQDAKNASEAYYSTGQYSSFYNGKPTYEYLTGANPNTNVPRMESEIIFFSGHGAYDHMSFNYEGKGGEYATGIYLGYTGATASGGYKFAGVKSFNMNKVGMAVYAGCNTGKEGVANIAEVTFTRGATVSMGWRHEVAAGSHTNWLKRFNKKLASGTNVWDSIDYANSFSYLDNKVKDISFYGDHSYTITRNARSVQSHYTELEVPQNHVLNISYDDPEMIDELVENYIKNNIDNSFELNSYNKEKNDTLDHSYYDYKLLVNDVLTDSGFTVITDNTKKVITKIIDNRIDLKNVPSVYSSSKQSEDVAERAKEKILANDNNSIENQEVKKIYDSATGTLKWYVRTVVYEKDVASYYVDEYYENI